MTATLSPFPVFRALNAGGVPLVGGKLFSYAAGTATPLATYTDASGGTPNTNPVILDASGSANVWLNGIYKLILQDSSGVQQWSIDNIGSGLVYGGDITVGAITASGAITALGNLTIGASKFTVNATTGNTVIAGNEAITGNLSVTGTTTLTGTSTGPTPANLDSSTNLATTAFVNSSNGASQVLLGTFSTSVGADLVINNFASTYDYYTIRFNNLIPVTNAGVILLNLSQNNAVSYLTANNRWVNFDVKDNNPTNTFTPSSNNSDSAIQILSVAMSNGADLGLTGIIETNALGGTTNGKTFNSNSSVYDGTNWHVSRGFAMNSTNLAAINGFKFSSSVGGGLKAGGKASIYGIRS